MIVQKFGSSTQECLDNVAKLILDKQEQVSCVILNYTDENVQTLEKLLRENGASQIESIQVRSLINLGDDFSDITNDLENNKESIKNTLSNKQGLILVHGFARKASDIPSKKNSADYSAALIAATLKASVIEVWTDVDGLLSANPHKVKKALCIAELSYEEVMELSHFSTRLLFPPSIQPALDANIPIHIRNAFNESSQGTIIQKSASSSSYDISGISSIDEVCLLQLRGSGMLGVSGVAKRLFIALSEEKINVILISQASSEHSICLAISPNDSLLAETVVRKAFSREIEKRLIEDIKIEEDCSIVAVVGSKMKERPGISGKMFSVLGKNGINVRAIAQGSSELNISSVISKKDLSKALNALHDDFFLSETKTLNLFLVGPGWVGSALLEQIEKHRASLKRDKYLSIRLAGVINSKKMLLEESGISLKSWKELLNDSTLNSELEKFINQMIALNLPNSVYVDCSANEVVADSYEKVLRSSISVVTPNKRANSGSYEKYLSLKNAAKEANVKYFYETNVGAGLPVIGTLNDLLASGDEIISIEGILSGTLSFIFNTYGTGEFSDFSQVVYKAKELGYTEPDPRDDLSGKDVARKLLVLAREMGIGLEEEQIELESLVPACCKDARSIEEFIKTLPLADDEFGKKLQRAKSENKVLRYIASISNGKAKVSLQAVGSDHPFYSLSGSDNIISFVSSRYKERPLVVKGPGAGVAVTAAGVFADIVRVGSYLT